MGLVGAAQYLNEVAMAHWELFAAKPYFTKNGFFVSVIFSFPLLLLAIVITVRTPSPTPQMHNIRHRRTHRTRKHTQAHDTRHAHTAPRKARCSSPPVVLQINFLVMSCEMMAKLKAAQLREKHKDQRKKAN